MADDAPPPLPKGEAASSSRPSPPPSPPPPSSPRKQQQHLKPPPTPFPLASNRAWSSALSSATTNTNSSSSIVHHVLVGEFDITTGSTVRAQFPTPVSGVSADWLADKMLPEGAHNHSLNETWFFLNRETPTLDEQEAGILPAVAPGGAGDHPPPSPSPFLYGFNVVKTQRDSAVRRGAVVKALAILSPLPFLHAFRPVISRGLDEYFRLSSSSSLSSSAPPKDGGGEDAAVRVLRWVYESLNSLDLGRVPRPTLVERRLMWRGVTAHSMHAPANVYTPTHPGWTHHTTLQWRDKEEETERIPLALPLALSSDDVGERSVASLIEVFGEDTMRIYHAMLMGKRVLFLSYNLAAADVCRAVLTAVSLVSPPFVGIIQRTFPYVSLSDLNFLQHGGGFIAGATNPMFARREEWWDLLCELDRGRCSVPGERAKDDDGGGGGGLLGAGGGGGGGGGNGNGGNKGGVLELEGESLTQDVDAAFLARVQAGAKGGGGLGEAWLRNCFTGYTQALVDLALDGSTQTNNSRAREQVRRMALVNSHRIKAIRKLAVESQGRLGITVRRFRLASQNERERERRQYPPFPCLLFTTNSSHTHASVN